MTAKQFEEKLEFLAEVKKQLARYETNMAPLTEQLEQLKFDIIRHMQSTKSKRTEAVNGYYVTRSDGRKTMHVTDKAAAGAWLEQNDRDLDEFLILDEKKLVQVVEDETKETGELVDFIEITQGNDYLSIKEIK